MKYDELIKTLRNCVRKEDNEWNCAVCEYENALDCFLLVRQEAADAIEELEAKLPHWVSVFDDLPRHNAVVVVSDGKRSWDVGQYHFLFNADDRTIWWWKKHTTRKVLWWMYKEDAIPEPPQEVQE